MRLIVARQLLEIPFLPRLGYSECAGVNELVNDGVTGRLAVGNGDIESLSAAIKQLMASPEDRRYLGSAGLEKMKIFDPKWIIDNWEQMFIKVISP